LLKDG